MPGFAVDNFVYRCKVRLGVLMRNLVSTRQRLVLTRLSLVKQDSAPPNLFLFFVLGMRCCRLLVVFVVGVRVLVQPFFLSVLCASSVRIPNSRSVRLGLS